MSVKLFSKTLFAKAGTALAGAAMLGLAAAPMAAGAQTVAVPTADNPFGLPEDITLFGKADPDEDPVFQPDGFQPIRTRLGVAYSDDCIEFGATWRRDFIDAGDARRGNAFQVFFALRNLGFR